MATNDRFGVDPLTKDMTAPEFYAHLLHEFAGNRTKVAWFLRGLGTDMARGFMHKSGINNGSFDNLSSEEQKALCDKLEKLCSHWVSTGYVTHHHTAEEFTADPVLRDAWINTVVIVTYHEQRGAQFWHNRWAIGMRGAVFFVNPETLEVVYQGKMDRGAEVLTGMTSKMGIDTQDINSDATDILDPEQRDTCKRLREGALISGHLSSKGDGSLLTVTSYTGSMIRIMEPVVRLFGTPYTHMWAEISLDMSNGKRLLVPATKGTLMEGGFMAPYMVTSMLSGTDICSRTELEAMDKNGMSYMDVWKTHGQKFISLILEFRFFDSLTDIQTFSFEAICKDRCGLFGDDGGYGGRHGELACAYTRDRLIFLGTYLSGTRFYIPHSIYGTLCHIPFEEPLWWDITHSNQIDRMMEDIGKLIFGQMSKQEYLTRNPPSNRGFDVESKEQVNDAMIDPEGWVFMKSATFLVIDPQHLAVIDSLGVPRTIYSKIKTPAYYRAHNFKPENIGYLVELSRTAGDIFPLSRIVAGISQGIVPRLIETGKQIMGLLDFQNPRNEILALLRRSHMESVVRAEAEAELKPKAKAKPLKDPFNGFEKRPFDIQCKLALNYRGFDFSALLAPIYLQEFPELSPATKDLKAICGGLTMTLQPWAKDYEVRVNDLDLMSPSVQDLIKACIGS